MKDDERLEKIKKELNVLEGVVEVVKRTVVRYDYRFWAKVLECNLTKGQKKALKKAEGLGASFIFSKMCCDCGQVEVSYKILRCKDCQKKLQIKQVLVSRRKMTVHRKNNNLCPDCGLPLIEGLTYCSKHREKRKKYLKGRREENLKLGFCHCGKPLLKNYSQCSRCLEHLIELKDYRMSKGLCIKCCDKVKIKNPKTGKLYQLCEKHRAQVNNSSTALILRRKKILDGKILGVCYRCHEKITRINPKTKKLYLLCDKHLQEYNIYCKNRYAESKRRKENNE